MITYDIPGMVYFTMTGEYGDNYGFEQLMVEWFRLFLPGGSQIDLLKEIRRYYSKKSVDSTSGMHVHKDRSRSSIGESHFQ